MKFLVPLFCIFAAVIADSEIAATEPVVTIPAPDTSVPLKSSEELVPQNLPPVDQTPIDPFLVEQPLIPKLKLELPSIALAKAERLSGLENERISLLRERLSAAGVVLPSVPLTVLTAAPRIFDTPEVAEARSALAQAVRIAESTAAVKIEGNIPEVAN
ncbi:hypothetical protein QAD02_023072 [Eretmocerus hayati]|uniref:Uncharacterized protein n=1 Tax=Eretmocerus hayati TaxID=131215 RepID=A0ACC2PUW9_9HYME|nr:hypothetical protein QAD02_023072 [Eretmocerus hayati]